MKKRTGIVGLAVFGLLVGGVRGKLRRYVIAETSMEPLLQAGNYIIARRRSGALVRGDIVIVPHPEIDGFELVKRVVGLPGETVTLSNGQLHIDGSVLAEPWADGPVRPDGEWVLGGNEAFVLGDNRPASAADSRTIGPVDIESIAWKVAARYWPPASIGRVSQSSDR